MATFYFSLSGITQKRFGVRNLRNQEMECGPEKSLNVGSDAELILDVLDIVI